MRGIAETLILVASLIAGLAIIVILVSYSAQFLRSECWKAVADDLNNIKDNVYGKFGTGFLKKTKFKVDFRINPACLQELMLTNDIKKCSRLCLKMKGRVHACARECAKCYACENASSFVIALPRIPEVGTFGIIKKGFTEGIGEAWETYKATKSMLQCLALPYEITEYDLKFEKDDEAKTICLEFQYSKESKKFNVRITENACE